MRNHGKTQMFGAWSMLAACVALVVFCSTLSAEEQGFYLEQKLFSSGVMGQPPCEDVSRIYVGNNRLKVITGGLGSMELIFDKGASAIYMINPQERNYYELSEKDYKALLKTGVQMINGTGGTNGTQTQITCMGGKENIGIWTTEKICLDLIIDDSATDGTAARSATEAFETSRRFLFFWATGMWLSDQSRSQSSNRIGKIEIRMEMWVSKDTKLGMNDYLNIAAIMDQFEIFKSVEDKLREIGGFPVRTRSSMTILGTKVESESTLQTLREETLPAATFRVPEGFTKKEGNFMQAMQEFQAGKQGAEQAQ